MQVTYVTLNYLAAAFKNAKNLEPRIILRIRFVKKETQIIIIATRQE